MAVQTHRGRSLCTDRSASRLRLPRRRWLTARTRTPPRQPAMRMLRVRGARRQRSHLAASGSRTRNASRQACSSATRFTEAQGTLAGSSAGAMRYSLVDMGQRALFLFKSSISCHNYHGMIMTLSSSMIVVARSSRISIAEFSRAAISFATPAAPSTPAGPSRW